MNRNVSPDSPFHSGNIPPKQYLEEDSKLALSPTKIDPSKYDLSHVQATGKMSEVGLKILKLGNFKKANYITTYEWGKEFQLSDLDQSKQLKSSSNQILKTKRQNVPSFLSKIGSVDMAMPQSESIFSEQQKGLTQQLPSIGISVIKSNQDLIDSQRLKNDESYNRQRFLERAKELRKQRNIKRIQSKRDALAQSQYGRFSGLDTYAQIISERKKNNYTQQVI